MADESVDYGGGDDVVREGFAPAAEGKVAGDDDGTLLAAGRDELEEQVGRKGVEGQVANVVDEDQSLALDLLELGVASCPAWRAVWSRLIQAHRDLRAGQSHREPHVL